MSIKVATLTCVVGFWCIGLLCVVGVHSQQKTSAKQALTSGKPIMVKGCVNCFVDLNK